MRIIKRLLLFFIETKFRYLFTKSRVRIGKKASFIVGNNVSIRNSSIHILEGRLEIADNCKINNVTIYVKSGNVVFGEKSIIRGLPKCSIMIDDGTFICSDHVRVQCKRIWIRFNGYLNIGRYTTINENSEIRCDEHISIGSYNQISYNVKIWDTNTHSIIAKDDRRKIAEKYFPYFGFEEQRPITKPIVIGDDCWIGENAAILKGTSLENGSIVGFNTIITGQNIIENSTVVQDVKLKIIETRI